MHTLTRRIALLLATFSLSTLLSSGVAHAGQGHGKQDMQARLCERLACTAAQQTQIKAIHDATAPQIKAARESMRSLREEQRAEWQKPTPSAAALERLDGQIDAQRDKVGDLRRAAKLKIHALLTAEQRAKFSAEKGRRGKPGKGRKSA
jgi:Spy/CpxP family protein refolding chaperone